jgi:outer membrane protein TolC
LKIFIHFIVLFVLCFACNSLIAQTKTPNDSLVWNGGKYVPYSSIPVDTVLFDFNRDLSTQLQPIDTIISYALRYSPSLKFEDASIEKAMYNLKYARYLWMNGITGFVNYTYGDQTNLNSLDNNGAVLNNSLGVGYRVGLNAVIPLTEVFGRPNRMKQLRSEYTMAKWKREERELEVAQRVIMAYFNLTNAQKQMKIRDQDAESARLTVEISNVEMKRGKIHPSELSRIKNLHAIAESNLELSRRDFMMFYYQLEVLVGVKLNTLRKK